MCQAIINHGQFSKVPGYTNLDVVDLSQYIPDCDHGSILVTTRSSRVDLGPRIQIQMLTRVEEGLAILLNASGRISLEKGTIRAMLNSQSLSDIR
jgi:hypothetical protein